MNLASYQAMSDPLSDLVANVRAKRIAEAQQKYESEREINRRALERELLDKRLQNQLEIEKAAGARQVGTEEAKLARELALLDRKSQSAKVSMVDPETGNLIEYWVPKEDYMQVGNPGLQSQQTNQTTQAVQAEETPAQKAIRLKKEKNKIGPGGLPIK